jgi:hypothetical protein
LQVRLRSAHPTPFAEEDPQCPPAKETGLTGDTTDEVSNLCLSHWHWLPWLTPTHFDPQASSLLPLLTPTPPFCQTPPDLRLVEHIEFLKHSGRVKWATRTPFLDAYAVSGDVAFYEAVNLVNLPRGAGSRSICPWTGASRRLDRQWWPPKLESTESSTTLKRSWLSSAHFPADYWRGATGKYYRNILVRCDAVNKSKRSLRLPKKIDLDCLSNRHKRAWPQAWMILTVGDILLTCRKFQEEHERSDCWGL